jgi:hypothetical protein
MYNILNVFTEKLLHGILIEKKTIYRNCNNENPADISVNIFAHSFAKLF